MTSKNDNIKEAIKSNDDIEKALVAFIFYVCKDDLKNTKASIKRLRELKKRANYPFLADLGIEALINIAAAAGLITIHTFTVGPRIKAWIKRNKT